MSTVRSIVLILRLKEAALMTGLSLIGAVFSIDIQQADQDCLLRLAVFVSGVLCLFAAIYSINGLLGYRQDQGNPRMAYFVQNSSAVLAISIVILSIAALVLLFLINRYLVLVGVICLLLWTAYSVPKRGFKTLPPAGTLTHFVSEIIFFNMGYWVYKPISGHSVLLSMYFSFLFSAGHLNHEAIDYVPDRKSGVRTLAVRYGPDRAIKLCNLLFSVSALYGLLLYVGDIWDSRPAILFLSAYVIQILTFGYLKKSCSGPALARRYSRAYRIIYFVACLAYLMDKMK